MKDKRLEHIEIAKTGHPAISEAKQVEVIHRAIYEVLNDENHIVRRIPFSEDYRNDTPEE